jgi:hypothetical protein
MAYEKANEGIAYGLCGLTPGQFGRMTPAEFYAIAQARIEQRNEEWRFLDILNGVQCSLLANINRSASASPYKAEDFRIMQDKKRADPDELVRKLGAWAASQGDRRG